MKAKFILFSLLLSSSSVLTGCLQCFVHFFSFSCLLAYKVAVVLWTSCSIKIRTYRKERGKKREQKKKKNEKERTKRKKCVERDRDHWCFALSISEAPDTDCSLLLTHVWRCPDLIKQRKAMLRPVMRRMGRKLPMAERNTSWILLSD